MMSASGIQLYTKEETKVTKGFTTQRSQWETI